LYAYDSVVVQKHFWFLVLGLIDSRHTRYKKLRTNRLVTAEKSHFIVRDTKILTREAAVCIVRARDVVDPADTFLSLT